MLKEGKKSKQKIKIYFSLYEKFVGTTMKEIGKERKIERSK